MSLRYRTAIITVTGVALIMAVLLLSYRLIVLGAVHGNETCGTQAIEALLPELDSGRLAIQRGCLTLVPVANPLAYARGTRQGDRNLNRRLQPTDAPREYEDHVANLLCPLLAEHDVLLDLHSFRSPGRPFVLRGPADNQGTLEPFRHEAAEARLAAHVGPARVVDGWMTSYAGGIERRRARAAIEDRRAGQRPGRRGPGPGSWAGARRHSPCPQA